MNSEQDAARESRAEGDSHAEGRAELGWAEGARDPGNGDLRADLAKGVGPATADARASTGDGAGPASGGDPGEEAGKGNGAGRPREQERGEKSGQNGSTRDPGSSDVRASLPPAAPAARFGDFSDPNPNRWANAKYSYMPGDALPTPSPPKSDTGSRAAARETDGDSSERPLPPAGEQEASREWKRKLEGRELA